MIKLALVVCFTACASADAGYGYGGYGYAGHGYGISNLGSSVGIAGYAPAAIPGIYGGYAGAGRYLANSAGVVHVAKREAEADAGYGYGGYGYGGYGYAGHGYGISNLGSSVGIAGHAPAAIPGVFGGYAGAGRYLANSAGVVHVAKREAVADAGYGYGGYGYAGYGYGITNLGSSIGIAGYAPAAIPGIYGGYAGAGRYLANSGGVIHVAKREAEADAGYLYGGYGYAGYGLGYSGLGYGYGLGYGRGIIYG